VTVADKPLLSMFSAADSLVPLPLEAGEPKSMALDVTVPRDAVVGDTYEFQVAQRDAKGRTVGGVTLRVNVVD
jgi:uncharacterized membrane protein